MHYNEETGIFTRILCTRNWQNYGDILGKVNKKDGYLYTYINSYLYSIHRLAWLYVYGYHAPELIDHINRDKLDNKINNLRKANKVENSRNSNVNINNKSGYRGVSFRKDSNKFRARIHDGTSYKCLGSYDTANEAGEVYDAAAKLIFGEFYYNK